MSTKTENMEYGQWGTVDGTHRAMVTDWTSTPDGTVRTIRVHLTKENQHLGTNKGMQTNGWVTAQRVTEITDYLDPNHA